MKFRSARTCILPIYWIWKYGRWDSSVKFVCTTGCFLCWDLNTLTRWFGTKLWAPSDHLYKQACWLFERVKRISLVPTLCGIFAYLSMQKINHRRRRGWKGNLKCAGTTDVQSISSQSAELTLSNESIRNAIRESRKFNKTAGHWLIA